MTCCCTVKVYCVSPGRTPQPLSTPGSTIVAPPGLPKLAWVDDAAAHSPLRAGFSRSQSTTLSLLKSVQPRLSTLRTIVAPGFVDVYGKSLAAYDRYLP